MFLLSVMPNDTLIVIIAQKGTGIGAGNGTGTIGNISQHTTLSMDRLYRVEKQNRTLLHSSWTVMANVQGFEIIIDETVALQKFLINFTGFCNFREIPNQIVSLHASLKFMIKQTHSKSEDRKKIHSHVLCASVQIRNSQTKGTQHKSMVKLSR